jgi:hypothetical protein
VLAGNTQRVSRDTGRAAVEPADGDSSFSAIVGAADDDDEEAKQQLLTITSWTTVPQHGAAGATYETTVLAHGSQQGSQQVVGQE